MNHKNGRISGLLSKTLLILAAAFFLWPVYWMISSSFKNLKVALQIPPQIFPLNPTGDNYLHLFERNPAWQWFWNSVFISVTATVLVVAVASLAAYALAKIKFDGHKIVFAVVIAGMTLPHSLMFIPLFKMMSSLNLLNSSAAVILPVVGWPFGVFLVRQFMQTIPTSLLEASRIDGCSELGTFLRVVLPMAKPGLGSLAIFTFLNTWNDYVWQMLVLKKEEMYTLPLGVQVAQKISELETNYGMAMAGATIATVPALIVFLCFQKYFTKGITLGAVKG